MTNTGMNWETKKLLDRREIAEYLSISPKTIYKWVFNVQSFIMC